MVSFEKPPGSSQGITIDSRVSWAYNDPGETPEAILEGRSYLAALQIARIVIIAGNTIVHVGREQGYL